MLSRCLLFLLLLPVSLAAQPTLPDTARTVVLPEATVTGYGQQLPLRRTAAAVGVVEAATFERFPQAALTQAVNTLPGVRLEERATASYRLSIRGSTLRSSFGVRNVKVYYEGIPFTEASGSTPLNLLDPAQIGQLEVLKGPAASVYGAGTGGAVLLRNRRPVGEGARTQVGFTVGSFGLRRYTAAAETGSATGYFRAQYARQTLDGYRQQSTLRRDVLALDGELRATEKSSLALHALYTDLNYQIPGSLTRAQFYANPRQARPATPTAPGTVEQQASYASRTALLGATYDYRFMERLSSKTTLYGTGSAIETPFLIDFERNTLLGGGVRTTDDIDVLLRAGADKVSVNSAAVQDPGLIDAGAERFGAQCVVLSVDVKSKEGGPGWEVYLNGGRLNTGMDAIGWLVEGERRGAGEFVLNSMDADGTESGYDLDLISAVAERTSVPIVASGGAGGPEHMISAVRAGAGAVLAASIFHFGEYSISEVKRRMAGAGVPVRRTEAEVRGGR